jgi:hypothetical protein
MGNFPSCLRPIVAGTLAVRSSEVWPVPKLRKVRANLTNLRKGKSPQSFP